MSTPEHLGTAKDTKRMAPRRKGVNDFELSPATRKLIKQLGLTYITTDELTIRRLRHGNGFRYVAADGTAMRGEEAQRLVSLAVPPAYEDVLYASDRSHPSDWPRCRRAAAIPLSSRLAEGARDAQGTPDRAARSSHTADPT